MTLTADSLNVIYLYLTSKTTIENPVYIFKFTSQTNWVDSLIVLTDISTNPIGYNQFELLVADAPQSPYNDYLNLLKGEYLLKVYQSIDSDIANAVDSFAGKEYIYEEKVLVIKEEANTSYTVPLPTQNKKGYING